jgi:hypothetical protein
VAVVNRPERLALLVSLAFFGFQAVSAQSAAPNAAVPGKEARVGNLDVVLLIDKSLSMASCIDDVRTYAASKVLSPILVPGDRLIIEAVYGKTERLFTSTISSEEDKAKAIRSIRSIKADGRFTDLGTALDAAKRDLDELGSPERPKYVLLLTDERQEAPKGSPYQAKDYKLKHPSLQYIKRVDLGKFRSITVGLQVGDKVQAAAPAVMSLLQDPPVRDLSAGAIGAGAIGAGAPAKAGGASSGAKGGATESERALPSWLLYGAAALLLLALVGLGCAFLISKKKDKDKDKKQEQAPA